MPGRAGNAFSGVAVAAIPGLGDAAAGDGPSEVAGVASGEGGTTEVNRTSPDPTASAPPTSRVTISAAATSSAICRRPRIGFDERLDGSARAARHAGLTVTRLPAGVVLASPSRRRSTSFQISGTGTRSRVAKRWRRSSIVVTKQLTETPPAPTEVGADREAVRPEAGCDVPDREVGVIEEDHRRTLGVGQQTKRREEVRIAVAVEVFGGSGGHPTFPPRAFSAPAEIRNAVRHVQAAGSRTAAPRLRTWAKASATASLAISASPANA